MKKDGRKAEEELKNKGKKRLWAFLFMVKVFKESGKKWTMKKNRRKAEEEPKQGQKTNLPPSENSGRHAFFWVFFWCGFAGGKVSRPTWQWQQWRIRQRRHEIM